MSLRNSVLAVAVVASGLWFSDAKAELVWPVSATGSSSYPAPPPPGWNDFYAIDTGPNHENTDWASNGQGAGSTLKMDLGQVYSIFTAFVTDRVTSGGANGSFSGGLSDFTFKFTLQAYTDDSFGTTLGEAIVVEPTLPVSITGPESFLTTVSSFDGLQARYIMYTVEIANLENGTKNPGLSDIHFEVAAVPEPSTWAMMILGFIGLGTLAYRRKKTEGRLGLA